MERAKILYVEDDPASLHLVERVLMSEGYGVISATDGLTAIETAAEEHPDLILMDINIGGLDGYEVTTRLRSIESLQDVPIVALTAATLKGARERALVAGCNGYISKPVDVDRLPEQVDAFLEGRRDEVDPDRRADYLVEYSQKLVDRLEGKIRELKAAHAELQQVEKVKSDFILLAGHELRTPLTCVYGYVQMLLQNPEIPGSVDEEGSPRHLLQSIADAVQRLSQVFDEIRNVSLIDSERLDLAFAPLPLGSLVRRVIRNLRNFGPERDLTIEVRGLESLPMLHGDEKRLYQAIWNVISNAMKYTPDGGRITIEGRMLEDAMVDLVVRDTGVGISPEDVERIFERFYVLEDTSFHHSSKTAFRGGGLGLGLTVARGIVEAHGGKIWAESEGHDEEALPGSTFHILLPIEPEVIEADTVEVGSAS